MAEIADIRAKVFAGERLTREEGGSGGTVLPAGSDPPTAPLMSLPMGLVSIDRLFLLR